MSPITVRRAEPADEVAISDLALGAERLVLHPSWSDLRRALRIPAPDLDLAGRESYAEQRAYDLYLAEADDQLGCFWGSVIEPPTVAQLWVLILHNDWPLYETLGALLVPVRRALRARAVTTLAFVGVEQWLLNALASNDFVHTNTVVTLQKSDWAVPDPGNRQVVIRPATVSDFRDILAIDERAFEPLWRNTARTLTEHLRTLPYFVVAELEGRVVGYEYASLIGRHGHLARLAVCPLRHGGRIGVRLLAEAVRFFRRERVFGLTVNTQRHNLRARRLYEWFGFRLLGREAEVWICTP
jgi:ribosomal protein S18 acetylase RimI-like enzyme